MSVADVLAQLLREMGGEIYTHTCVNRIMTEGRRACGVLTDSFPGSRDCFIDADVVVANVDTPTAYSRLVPASLRRKHTDQHLAAKEYGCSAHLLYLGVRDLEGDFRHHEVLLSNDYSETLNSITKRKTVPDDPAHYVCIPTRTDPFARSGRPRRGLCSYPMSQFGRAARLGDSGPASAREGDREVGAGRSSRPETEDRFRAAVHTNGFRAAIWVLSGIGFQYVSPIFRVLLLSSSDALEVCPGVIFCRGRDASGRRRTHCADVRASGGEDHCRRPGGVGAVGPDKVV